MCATISVPVCVRVCVCTQTYIHYFLPHLVPLGCCCFLLKAGFVRTTCRIEQYIHLDRESPPPPPDWNVCSATYTRTTQPRRTFPFLLHIYFAQNKYKKIFILRRPPSLLRIEPTVHIVWPSTVMTIFSQGISWVQTRAVDRIKVCCRVRM